MKRVLLIPLMITLLAAMCAVGCSSPTPTPTPTPTPSSTPTVAPSSTPTSGPTSSATPAVAPTPTEQEWVPPIAGMKKGEEDLYFEWQFAQGGRRSPGPPGYDLPPLENFFTELEKATGGRFKMKYAYAGMLGAEKELPSLIAGGVVDVAHIPTSLDPSGFALLNMVDNWGWDTGDMAIDSKLSINIQSHPLALANLDKMGMVWGYTSPTLPMKLILAKGTKKVETVADLAGLQFGTSGYSQIWAEQLGMVPVNLPATQYYESLQKGMIDMVPMDESAATRAFKLQEVADYVIDLPLASKVMIGVVSKTSWEKLPQYIKDLWRQLLPTAMDDYTVKSRALELAPAVKILQDAGVEIYKLAPEEQAKIEAAYGPMWDTWVADTEKFPTGKNVRQFLQEQIAYRNQLTGQPWTVYTP